MKIYPCAKINLGLNVVERRSDGYHNLETVFFPVNIYDEIDIQESREDGCHLIVEGVENLCEPEKNLVVKAYNMLREEYDIPGIDLILNKKLPSQAGMGGGSSDGAYTISALNKMFSLGMTKEDMQCKAARLGADCPFFITAEPAYAEGIGEILSPINKEDIFKGKSYRLVLVKPDVSVSTKEAYAGVNPTTPKINCREVVIKRDINEWRELLINDFENSVFQKLPILKDVKENLYANGALYSAMSGSGSTIFGIFAYDNQIENTIKKLQLEYASKYYFQVITI